MSYLVEVKLFGVLKRTGIESVSLSLGAEEFGSGLRADQIKQKVRIKILEVSKIDPGDLDELLNVSALADDDQIYHSDHKVMSPKKLALLPPVCGG